jgi:uncharacterized membrane protein
MKLVSGMFQGGVSMDLQDNKVILGIVAFLLLLLAATVFIYNGALNNLAAGSCSDTPETCPHEKVVQTQDYIIAFLIIVIGAVVAWIFLYIRKLPNQMAKPQAETTDNAEMALPKAQKPKPKKIDISKLDSDERKIIGLLQENDGSTFQSDIVKGLGYSKVKITRILDKMEQHGLIERKRRGMANLVVLK